MKKNNDIIGKQLVVNGLIIAIFLLFPINGISQKGKEITFTAYPGYTLVNFEKALGYSDDYMEYWDQFHYGGSLKGFILSDKPIQFGAEAGWQRLYYAYYIVPYGPSPVYREFNVSTLSLMGLIRYSVNSKFFASGGAGVHIFDNGIAPAISAEAGYFIKAGKNLRIPVSLRMTPILGSGLPITVCLGAGGSIVIR